VSPGRSLRDDERGLVGKSLVVSMVLILLVGLALVEGGSVLFAKLQVQDLAQATAVEGAATLRNTNSAAVAEEAARRLAHDRDPDVRLTAFVVLPDGSVRVTLKKKARTFIVQHVSFLEDLAVVKATETAHPPTI
jgi:Flp pilus assembly protein TadG